VNQTNPAIVSQQAVQQLPRWLLFILCGIYILAGFIGREPWKAVDINAFGFMLNLATGQTDWLRPEILGQAPEVDGLIPYNAGALFIYLFGQWLTPALASRLPFMLMMTLAFTCTWYAVYYLARSPQAQPIAFAFGGEAKPKDYARALADASVLAFVSCLGLAQPSHEITPMVFQLGFFAMAFSGACMMPFRPIRSFAASSIAIIGLSLSGAPTIACVIGLWTWVTTRLDREVRSKTTSTWFLIVLAFTVACIFSLDLFRWRIATPDNLISLRNWFRLLIWFTWPVWPLCVLALWRWRSAWNLKQVVRHLQVPLMFSLIGIVSAWLTWSTDRTLILALPCMSALAVFALPTLNRSVLALIDWFTLLFFSSCAFVIWVVWLAAVTDWPAQPAANVARLLPGFQTQFDGITFLIALMWTICWIGLVHWRVGRHRYAIWKSLALPAGGAALCWVLLTTLWLPLLDFARSYKPLISNVSRVVPNDACVYVYGLSSGQLAGFQYHGAYQLLVLNPKEKQTSCDWLIVDADALSQAALRNQMDDWSMPQKFRRPSDDNEDVIVFQRKIYKSE